MASPVSVLCLGLAPAKPAAISSILAAWPGSRLIPAGLEVPLCGVGPEEVLAACITARLVVVASLVVRRASAVGPAGATSLSSPHAAGC
jgi:hypothetical protein